MGRCASFLIIFYLFQGVGGLIHGGRYLYMPKVIPLIMVALSPNLTNYPSCPKCQDILHTVHHDTYEHGDIYIGYCENEECDVLQLTLKTVVKWGVVSIDETKNIPKKLWPMFSLDIE